MKLKKVGATRIKTLIIYPIYKGKRSRERGSNYKEISLLLVLGKTFPGTLAGRLTKILAVGL